MPPNTLQNPFICFTSPSPLFFKIASTSACIAVFLVFYSDPLGVLEEGVGVCVGRFFLPKGKTGVKQWLSVNYWGRVLMYIQPRK